MAGVRCELRTMLMQTERWRKEMRQVPVWSLRFPLLSSVQLRECGFHTRDLRPENRSVCLQDQRWRTILRVLFGGNFQSGGKQPERMHGLLLFRDHEPMPELLLAKN